MPEIDYTQVGALNQFPENINILKDTKFKFFVRRLPNVNFFCTAINIPELNLDSPPQNTPFSKVPLPGTGLSFGSLEVEFLVDEKMKNYYEMFTWLKGLGFVKDYSGYASLKAERLDVTQQYGGTWSDCYLSILTNEGNPSVSIVYRNAFPIRLSELRFDTTKAKAEPLTAKATFAFTYYDFEYPEV